MSEITNTTKKEKKMKGGTVQKSKYKLNIIFLTSLSIGHNYRFVSLAKNR